VLHSIAFSFLHGYKSKAYKRSQLYARGFQNDHLAF